MPRGRPYRLYCKMPDCRQFRIFHESEMPPAKRVLARYRERDGIRQVELRCPRCGHTWWTHHPSYVTGING